MLVIFEQKIEIAELGKGVHCLDLDESFQTHIYLQSLASIQPGTSPVKFARSQPALRISTYLPTTTQGIDHPATAQVPLTQSPKTDPFGGIGLRGA